MRADPLQFLPQHQGLIFRYRNPFGRFRFFDDTRLFTGFQDLEDLLLFGSGDNFLTNKIKQEGEKNAAT